MDGDWNFEGSIDGNDWDILQEARNDKHLRIRSIDINPVHQNADELPQLADRVKELTQGQTTKEWDEVCLHVLEQEYRHTWKLDPAPTQFYRYFLIIGAGSERDRDHSCLHPEGLELFGDVCEE